MSPELDGKAAVEQLPLRLFYARDMHDYAGVVSSFHENGTWLRMGQRLLGPAQMRQALERRAETMAIHHVITNVLFEEADASRCRLGCYLTAYRHDSRTRVTGPAPLRGPARVGICRAQAARKSAAEGRRLSYLDGGGPTFVSAS